MQRPGALVQGECRLRHKDGGWRHIESIAVNRLGDPPVNAIVVNYRDVTLQRVAAEALRASEARLRDIVERAQDLIYYCDALGRFTYVNPTAARLMQYSEDELLGRHFFRWSVAITATRSASSTCGSCSRRFRRPTGSSPR